MELQFPANGRDPLQDVMIEISPISGTIWFLYARKLEIVISFKLEGTGESFSIYTQRHWTTVQGEESVDWLFGTWYEWTAYFDGTHDSPDALHYYINIEDDIRIQSNELELKLQLWRINKHWDNKHLSGYDTYSINDVGYSEIVNVSSVEEIQSVPMKTEAKINVTTIGVEKANTIAIYETNGTAFNGHYQEQERMNILQLYVNDSGAGTPFVEGQNVIVIPTSLFTETVFNAYVQNETLSETPIYSADEDIFMFISVGRDGNTEQACEEIDFIFIRFEISSEDAMEVLTLLLTCLVNETTNETAIVYSYVSTKLNNTTAVMMNLAISVLGFIPWFCNFTESPAGSKPETKDDVFWKPLKTLGKAIVGVIIFIGMTIIAFVELIKDFVIEILMEWLPIFEYILWLIIKVIVLILVWIEFVFTLLIIITLFIIITGLLFTLSVFLNININATLNNVEVQGDIELLIKYNVGWDYCEFLDLKIPKVEVYFKAFNFTFTYSTSFFLEDLKFTEVPDNLLTAFSNISSPQSSNEFPKESDESNNILIENLVDFITGIGIAWGISGGFVCSIASALLIIKKAYRETCNWHEKLITLIGLGIYTASMIIMIFTILEQSFVSALGLGIGFLTAGLWFWHIGDYMKSYKYNKYIQRWKNDWLYEVRQAGNREFNWKGIFEIIDFVGGITGLVFDIESIKFGQWEEDEKALYDIFVMTLSLGTGLVALILAKNALIFFGGSEDSEINFYKWRQPTKTKFAKFFSIVSVIFGIICFGIAFNRYISE